MDLCRRANPISESITGLSSWLQGDEEEDEDGGDELTSFSCLYVYIIHVDFYEHTCTVRSAEQTNLSFSVMLPCSAIFYRIDTWTLTVVRKQILFCNVSITA